MCIECKTLNIMASVTTKVLSLREKVNFINVSDKGKKKAEVSREFGLVNSTVLLSVKTKKILSAKCL